MSCGEVPELNVNLMQEEAMIRTLRRAMASHSTRIVGEIGMASLDAKSSWKP
jgi:hypothetical protein